MARDVHYGPAEADRSGKDAKVPRRESCVDVHGAWRDASDGQRAY